VGEQVSDARILGRLEEAVSGLRREFETHRVEDRAALASIDDGVSAIKLRLGIDEALEVAEEKGALLHDRGRARLYAAWPPLAGAVMGSLTSWLITLFHR
jgi:hypothetical protein